MPEAQSKNTNNRGILSALLSLNCKHIIMARDIAEGPILLGKG